MSDPNAIAAKKLWVQLATRITTQGLHFQSGDEETAAKSVYDLFKTCRDLMSEHPAAAEFSDTAERMLNRVIRPCTARWHGWMTEDKEKSKDGEKPALRFISEPVRRVFRKELAELRKDLELFEKEFRRMAGEGGELEAEDKEKLEKLKNREVGTGKADLYDSFAGRILRGVDVVRGDLKWNDLEKLEHEAIRKRREKMGRKDGVENVVGLAISGGGIRSATFALGGVTALARHGLIQKVDYMSTVSGGGYLGTFLSSFLEAKREPKVGPQEAVDGLFEKDPPDSPESSPLRHLRNNSTYLLNGGTLRMIGVLISGIMTNLGILLSLVLLAVVMTGLLQMTGFWNGWGDDLAKILSFTAAGLWLAYFVVQRLSEKWRPLIKIWGRVTLTSAVLAVVAWAMSGVMPLIEDYYELTERLSAWWNDWDVREGIPGSFETWVAIVLAILPLIVGSTASASKSSRWLSKTATWLFAVSGPLLCLFVYLSIGWRVFLDVDGSWDFWPVMLVTIGLLIWGWLIVNVNKNSLHQFYRNRLSDCYLVRPKKNSGVESVRRVPLSSLGSQQAAPYHLINCAANLPNSPNAELRGRETDFFTFTRDYCGCPLTGYAPMEKMEKWDRHIDLGTAMAISGAAVSSSMGILTPKAFRFLITMLNLRLGYWIPNPGNKHVSVKGSSLIGPPSGYHLFKEFFGRGMTERKQFVNISDGGHLENLAVYELLRRRCKFVVSLLSARDPELTFGELRHLQRMAHIDLGVKVEIVVRDIELNVEGMSTAHAALGKIHYPPIDENGKGEHIGWLLLIQQTLTGIEPDYVLDYKRTHPDFPHESTGDQLYDESQFEAYRALGETAVENLFSDEVLGERIKGKTDFEQWFQSLATRLLPDNDEVFSGIQDVASGTAKDVEQGG